MRLRKPLWLRLAEIVGVDIRFNGRENKLSRVSHELNKMSDERKLELIMRSEDVYDMIAHSTEEMERLHELKWKL